MSIIASSTSSAIAPSGAIHPAAPAVAYLAAQRSAMGRQAVESDLRKIARLLGAADWRDVDWTRINAAAAQAVIARLTGAPSTINRALSTLRGVARSAWQLGCISAEELQRVLAIKGVRGSRLPRGRHLQRSEIAALLDACNDGTARGKRDAAMIALAAATGMRREEIVSLRVSDMDDSSPDALTLRIVGKGNKQREVFVVGAALSLLREWLRARGTADGYVFCCISNDCRMLTSRRLSTVAAHKILQRRAQRAGVQDVSWHDFRRTVAGSLLSLGEDISTVARLLGHAHVATTMRYDRRPSEQLLRAARRLADEYRR
ncbi:MAG: tyrosine-type recombinase/integrase [Anaerolineae bacterium]|nr:tyrosine-type recombinase/integrase [Anaerolineae bacterium]